MSDFDERLTAVLTAESDGAPHPGGLAAAARRRHVVRRRRRIAIGGVAAALVIAAPVAVVGTRGGGDDRAADDPASTPQWQTVARDDVRVEIPGDWEQFTCDFDGFTSDVYGPDQDAACTFGTYVAFYASATFDPIRYPGEVTHGSAEGPATWSGYVYAGQYAVSASTVDPDLTRRILASARVDGQPEVAAPAWPRSIRNGISYAAPDRWGVGADASDGYYVKSLELEPIDESLESSDQLDASHYRLRHQLPHVLVTVVAPTEAVAELVAGTLRLSDGGPQG